MTDEETIGYNIIIKALREPIKMIAANSGISGADVIAQVAIRQKKYSNDNYGYNFLTDEYCDLMKNGVIDPAKVVKSALVNAAGVASMLLTTEVSICDTPEDEPPAPARLPKGHSQ